MPEVWRLGLVLALALPALGAAQEVTVFGVSDSFRQTPKTVTAEGAVVVVTNGEAAVAGALESLRRNGNAMDAALTAALAQVVLSAGSWDSLAGILNLLYYDAATGQVHALNAGYDVPREETDALSIPGAGTASGRTVLVPGFIAGVEAGHRRFGRLPFARLFDPAAALAEQGFRVDGVLARLIDFRRGALTRRAEGRRIFTRDGARGGGLLYRQGDLLRQPELARTLRRVAAEGAAYMYKGPWAAELVRAVRGEGGKLSLDDLARYRARWAAPLRTAHRGYEVVAPPPPSLGGVCAIEGLNLVEAAGLPRLGHPAASAESLYWFLQIAQECYAGYLPYAPPPQRRVEQAAARRRWRQIHDAGGFTFLGSLGSRGAAGHSDAVVVVDRDGNVAALGHSINTTAWGTTGLFVGGVSIPDSASFQQSLVARTGPGGRLPDALNPLFALAQGRPVLASSSTGASLHEATLQNVSNVLDYGMDVQRSLAQPNFLRSVWPQPGLLQMAVWGGCILAFLAAAVVWPLRLRRAASIQPRGARLAGGLGWLIALLNLGFLAGLAMAYQGKWALPETGLAPWLAAGLALGAAAAAAWRRGWWSRRERLFYSALALAALVFVPSVHAFTQVLALVEHGAFPAAVLAGVRTMGQPVVSLERDPPLGYWVAIQIDAGTGARRGAATQRSWDEAVGALTPGARRTAP